MKTKRFVTALISSLLLIIALQACNTMKGAGEDIQEGGRAIEDAAE
jgi:predicted small secreted protein